MEDQRTKTPEQVALRPAQPQGHDQGGGLMAVPSMAMSPVLEVQGRGYDQGFPGTPYGLNRK